MGAGVCLEEEGVDCRVVKTYLGNGNILYLDYGGGDEAIRGLTLHSSIRIIH